MARSLINVGSFLYDLGDYQRAKQMFTECLAIARELGDKEGIAHAHYNLSIITRHDGDYPAAQMLLRDILAGFYEVGYTVGVQQCFTSFAHHAAQVDEMLRTVRLLAAAANLAHSMGIAITPEQQSLTGEATTLARSQLSATEFDAAWAEGAAMSLAQAIEYALARADVAKPHPKRV